MTKNLRTSRAGRFVLAVAMFAIGMSVGVGAMVAAHGSDTVYYACVNNNSGTIKMVSESATCGQNEQLIIWNQQGPKGDKGDPGDIGPVGPQGDDGAPGPQGEPGVSGHEIVWRTVRVDPGDFFSTVLHCPAGKVVTGGGVDANLGIVYTSKPVQQYQDGEFTYSGWAAAGQNQSIHYWTASVYAICVNAN